MIRLEMIEKVLFSLTVSFLVSQPVLVCNAVWTAGNPPPPFKSGRINKIGNV